MRDRLFAIFVASLSGAGPWALLRWKPLGFLGHISYSVYLLHEPMIYIVSVFGLGPSKYAAMRPLALYATLLAIGAMTIIVSTVTFIFVEKPFLRRVALAAKPVGGRPDVEMQQGSARGVGRKQDVV